MNYQQEIIDDLNDMYDNLDGLSGAHRAILFLARCGIEQWVRDQERMREARRCLFDGYSDQEELAKLERAQPEQTSAQGEQ